MRPRPHQPFLSPGHIGLMGPPLVLPSRDQQEAILEEGGPMGWCRLPLWCSCRDLGSDNGPVGHPGLQLPLVSPRPAGTKTAPTHNQMRMSAQTRLAAMGCRPTRGLSQGGRERHPGEAILETDGCGPPWGEACHADRLQLLLSCLAAALCALGSHPVANGRVPKTSP